jgi:hypothetical protein
MAHSTMSISRFVRSQIRQVFEVVNPTPILSMGYFMSLVLLKPRRGSPAYQSVEAGEAPFHWIATFGIPKTSFSRLHRALIHPLYKEGHTKGDACRSLRWAFQGVTPSLHPTFGFELYHGCQVPIISSFRPGGFV